jgi:hypothetical protein
MNRDKSPGRMDKIKFDRSKMTPSPMTYQIDKKDINKILSTKEKTQTFTIRKPEKKLMRFTEIHAKSKNWVPGVAKYNVTADQ